MACGKRETIALFDGSYEFKDLEEGVHAVAASLKGFETRSMTVNVKSHDETDANFRLPEAKGAAEISGIVYDAGTQKPVASSGTVILIMPLANRYAALIDGRYEFDHLVGGEYDLSTSVPGYEDRKLAITLGENERKVENFYCSPVLSVEPPWG